MSQVFLGIAGLKRVKTIFVSLPANNVSHGHPLLEIFLVEFVLWVWDEDIERLAVSYLANQDIVFGPWVVSRDCLIFESLSGSLIVELHSDIQRRSCHDVGDSVHESSTKVRWVWDIGVVSTKDPRNLVQNSAIQIVVLTEAKCVDRAIQIV